jgi:uncharacterized protein YjbI with pentapeptide repeats
LPDPPDRWAGLRATFEPKPEGSDQEELAALRGAVDEAAGLLRALTFTYLAVWAYVVIAAGSVSHRQLLVGTDVQLPLLGTGVDLGTFFWLAPTLFLVLHGNVLVQLYLLARRVRRFDEAARRLGDPEREAHARSLLAPFPFVEWRAGRETAHAMHAIFALVNWALYIILPLFLFLFIQFRFLPYQDDWITWFHVALIGADLALLWLVWPRLNQARGGWWRGIRELWRGRVSRPLLVLAPVLSLLCVLLGVLFRFDQRPDELAWLEAPASRIPLPRWEWLFTRERLAELDEKQPPSLAALLEYRWSRISVTGATLMRREPAPEVIAEFRREAGPGKEEEGERRAYLDAELAEPVSLAGRHLRQADLRGSKLWGARLGRADLQGADLSDAQLQGADLSGAQLQGADLGRTQLQDADLRKAQFREPFFILKAQVRNPGHSGSGFLGAVFGETQLQRADLREAQLQGTALFRTQLQGADLSGAQLQGAILFEVQLQGADLSGAELQGADLSGAQLLLNSILDPEPQGADLSGNQLQGANLRGAQLQGADLREAQLFFIKTNTKTNFSRVDLRRARAEALTSEAQIKLKTQVKQAIIYPTRLAHVLNQLKPVLSSEQSLAWELKELPKDKRRDTIMAAGAPKPLSVLLGGEVLLSPGDDGKYGKALTEELVRLACRMGDSRIANRFVRRIRSLDHGMYVSDLARYFATDCPDLISKLDLDVHQYLVAVNAKAATSATESAPQALAPNPRPPPPPPSLP